MRFARVGLVALLFSCGDKSRSTMEIITPTQLEDARVLERSEAVVVASLSAVLATTSVQLLDPSTYAEFAKVEGEPVWAGRASWRDTVLRSRDPDSSELTLTKPDSPDKLVVSPPDATGWRLAFKECGAALCSLTWRSEVGAQHVDVVDMKALAKVASYGRAVAAQLGATDPARDVVYHVDRGLRLVAEEQRSGRLLWSAPVDPPTKRKNMDMEELQILVTADGRYVLAIWGWFPYRREYLDPELALFDAATGTSVAVEQKRFDALTNVAVWISPVPGTANILITDLAVRSAIGESRDVGLHGLEEVSLPALASVSRFSVPKDHWWASHAPGQVVPLASGRVLFAGR